MVYTTKQYNTRNSGRYNSGQFVPAGPPQVSENTQQIPMQQQQQQQQPFPQRQPQQQNMPKPPQFPQQNNLNSNNSNPQFQKLEVQDVVMKVEPGQDGPPDELLRPYWMKSKLPGVKKLSKKERRRRQNEHLRRIITPKNALMVLNEMVLHEQLTNFKVEQAEVNTQYYKAQKPSYCADLTLDGVTYKGFGENKLTARNAAAEQAIRALIIKRMNKDVSVDPMEAEESAENDDDPLPMIQLASYALHKLFSEWEYEGHKVPQLKPVVNSSSEAESEPIPPPSPKPRAVKKPKELPLNASTMHPCMLLTYMRPQLEYRELAVEGDRPQNMLFTMGVEVDGATYIGKAPNKKEARKAAARAACHALFGVAFDERAALDNAPRLPAPPAPPAPPAAAAPAAPAAPAH